MRLKAMSVGSMQANCYIVADEKTNEAVIFDPGDEPERIIEVINNNKFNVKSIVLTHSHFDHIGGCSKIKEIFDVPLIICEGEEAIISNADLNLTSAFESGYTLNYDYVLKDGEKYSIGELEFKTIHTPGHTPGGACYFFEKEGVLISGDTLFRYSIGRTDFPMGSTKDIIKSLSRLSLLDDDVIVYPGHGNSTTILEEKEHNPYMQSALI